MFSKVAKTVWVKTLNGDGTDPMQKWQRFNILLSTFKVALLASFLS